MAMISSWLALLIGTTVLLASCQSAKQEPKIVVYEPGSASLEELYQEARAAYLADSFRTAAEKFEKVVAADPQHLKALINWGAALSRGGLPQEALPKFQQALLMDPNQAAAWYNMGVALERLGRHDEALEHYQRAVELDSSVLTPALQRYIHSQETRQQERRIGAAPRNNPNPSGGSTPR
jgi:tetratricopeptide (TPR) repeat protein